MSLKAYDGMMTKKGIPYIYEKIQENLPLFEKTSRTHVANAMATFFVAWADNGLKPQTKIGFGSTTRFDRILLEELEGRHTTILGYLYEAAEILQRSEFVNDFTSHLNLIIEPARGKTLVWPMIRVLEHRRILLSFLEDWYAQNQTDPPEGIPTREWNRRVKDWYEFNETRGLQMRIVLFGPHHYWNNLMEHFRGDELIDAILKEIPSEEDRMNRIWRDGFIGSYMKEANVKSYYTASFWMKSEEGQIAFAAYKEKNPITLVKIDKDYISNVPLPL